MIPRDALRNADKVYVVDADNKLDIRSVEVISTSVDQVLISAGVQVGEKVAISTVPNAAQGMLVEPISKGLIDEALVSQL